LIAVVEDGIGRNTWYTFRAVDELVSQTY